MGITFLVTFITGLFNWTLLMRTLGLTGIVLPLALMSEIHTGPVCCSGSLWQCTCSSTGHGLLP